MAEHYPIIWTEGALLSQQHFQYWESWLLDQQAQCVNALVPDAYGLVSCEFDQDSFRQQKCVLKSLVWRSEKGRWLVYDSKTMPAVAAALEDCPEQMVYLNLPNNKLCAGLSGYDSSGDLSAYKAEYRELGDRYDSSRRQEITLGVPELRLTTTAGDPQHYDSWPLIKIKRLVNTQFEIDNNFIPGCLTVSGSSQLQSHLARVVQHLGDKSKSLKNALHSTQDNLLAQEYIVVSQALFDLKEMLRKGSSQPKDVYCLLVKTLISLSILSGQDFQPEIYKHAASGELIIAVSSKLNALLNQKVETLQTYLMIKNNQHYPCVEDIDAAHVQGHSWYLGIDFSHQPQDQIQKLMTQAKLGTLATLEQIIASALPGIPFTHVSRPPNRINPAEGYEYFRLDHESIYWKHVKEERSLMLYLPSLLDGNKITLDIVKE